MKHAAYRGARLQIKMLLDLNASPVIGRKHQLENNKRVMEQVDGIIRLAKTKD